jgi:hypothetical protein
MAFICAFSIASAQLPNGSTAPNFTSTDLDGNTHTLYDILDQGYVVYIKFFATWCGPCWSYHNTHAFQDLWEQRGPSGTNEAFVFQVEGDFATNTACLYGPSGCNNSTYGNWVSGVTHPTLDDPTLSGLFQISFYPTVYMICPADKSIYVVGQLNATGLWNASNSFCPPLVVNIAVEDVQDVTCFGTSTGAINITPSGGQAPYTYAWSNGANSQDLQNVPAGTYSCTITSSNGVMGETGPIEVAQPADPLAIEVVSVNMPGCNGIPGSIAVDASGGWSSGYTFQWSNGQQGQELFGLQVGNYTVTVADGGGCTKTQLIALTPPVPPVAAIAPPPVLTCSPPAIQIDGSGSSQGFEITYLWLASNGGNIVSGASTPNPTVNAAGNYTLRVTNTENTCFAIAVTSVSADQSIPAAEAGPSGLIDCIQTQTTLAGAAPSGTTVLWTGPGIVSGANTPTPVVNQNGTYTMVVTNTSNGCAGSDSTQVVANVAPPVVALPGQDYLHCNRPTVTLQSTGSSEGPGFTYLWTGPGGYSSMQQNPVVSNAGPYTLLITNTSNGCTNGGSTPVDEADPIELALDTLEHVRCHGVSEGLLGISATGGSGAHQYLWSTGETTATLSELAAGAYTVTVTDADACSSTQSYTIGQPDVLLAAVSTTHETSQQGHDGTAAAQSTGGTAPYSWLWNTGATTDAISGLEPGTYTVTTTDSNGCTSVGFGVVNAFNCPPILVVYDLEHPTCPQSADGSISVSIASGIPPFTYTWNMGANTPEVNNLSSGTYTLVISDEQGCATGYTFELRGVDTQAPLATCPDNRTAVACADNSAVVNYSAPSASDNCSLSSTQGTLISGLTSGASFPVGTTVQTYQFADESGNTATCSFSVTVLESVAVSGIQVTPATVGSSNGGIVVTVTGGQAPYTYTWLNGGNVIASSRDLENVPPGQYVLRVTDASGCVVETAVIEVGSIVRVTEPDWAKTLVIQPNPGNGRFHLIFGQILPFEAHLRVLDANGRLVYQGRYDPTAWMEVDLTAAPTGSYTLQLRCGQEQMVRTVVVQR